MNRCQAIEELMKLVSIPLGTERLIIRALRSDDREDIYRIIGSDNVMKAVGSRAFTYDELALYYNRVEENIQTGYKIGLVVEEAKSECIVATVGVKLKNIKEDVVEFEYLVNENYWGKGYMTECIETLIDYISSINYPLSIEANCRVENIGSRRVMEKNNMRYFRSDYYDNIEYKRYKYRK